MNQILHESVLPKLFDTSSKIMYLSPGKQRKIKMNNEYNKDHSLSLKAEMAIVNILVYVYLLSFLMYAHGIFFKHLNRPG